MREYTEHIETYSSRFYLINSSISEPDWGDKPAAERYLHKYWLPNAEYLDFWRPLQNQIFINQEYGLPEPMLSQKYEVLTLQGGVTFVEEDFVLLQQCFYETGDKFFVVIENTFGGNVKEPILRMKYPAAISWNEFTSGNFISSVLFECPIKEYFVFGDSGIWGKYVANEYKYPVDILGFKSDYSKLFKTKFRQSDEELKEIAEWLPTI